MRKMAILKLINRLLSGLSLVRVLCIFQSSLSTSNIATIRISGVNCLSQYIHIWAILSRISNLIHCTLMNVLPLFIRIRRLYILVEVLDLIGVALHHQIVVYVR